MEQDKELTPVTVVTEEIKKEQSVETELEKTEVNEPIKEETLVGEVETIESTHDNHEIINDMVEIEEPKPITMEEEVEAFESSQEEHAIISVEELMEASKNITEEEIEQYEDDGNEPISIKELEALYKSVEEPVKLEIPVVEEKISFPELDIKAKPASEVYEGKTFKNSDVISPVFGLKATEESITLEHTANLDKLNEEIRKTNEFLSALKELRKNLD